MTLRFAGAVLAITAGGCDTDRAPIFETGSDTGSVDSDPSDSGTDTGDSGVVVIEPSWTWEGHVTVEVAAKEYSACAMDDHGFIECWGTDANESGLADPPEQPLQSMAVAEHHACGIDEYGSAVCWGCGNYDSDDGEEDADFGQCEPPDRIFVKLSLNSHISYGLTADGTVWTWGGSVYREPDATELASGVADFSAGGILCVIRPAGELECDDSYVLKGQIPEGSFSRVETRSYEACVRDTEGYVTCWGEAEYHGELPFVKALDFAAGKMSACLIHESDGRIECIGPVEDEHPIPTGSYTQIAGNSWLGYAIRDDGVLVRWGDPTEDVIYDD